MRLEKKDQIRIHVFSSPVHRSGPLTLSQATQKTTVWQLQIAAKTDNRRHLAFLLLPDVITSDQLTANMSSIKIALKHKTCFHECDQNCNFFLKNGEKPKTMDDASVAGDGRMCYGFKMIQTRKKLTHCCFPKTVSH